MKPKHKLKKREKIKMVILLGVFLLVFQGVLLGAIDFRRLCSAIDKAEGGSLTRFPYGIKSVKCSTRRKCLNVCLNTVKNSYKAFSRRFSGARGDYLSFLASRYAPLAAHPLNRNWEANVRYFLKEKP